MGKAGESADCSILLHSDMFAAALDDIDGNNSDSLSPASIIEAALG
jgi:hypothetical protein